MRNNEAGFTFIEVMAAMFIFLIGMMAVLTLQVTAIKGSAKASDIKEAVQCSASCAEKILTRNYSDVQNIDKSVGKFQLVTEVETHSSDLYKEILITVQWQDKSRTHTHKMKQIKFNENKI